MAIYWNYFTKKVVPIPNEGRNDSDINIVLHKQSTIQGIVDKFMENSACASNEFQFHYHALQTIITAPSKNRMVLTIPLVYFNFPQVVSTAHVSFDLREIAEISQQMEPIAQENARTVLSKLEPILKIYQEMGYEVVAKVGEIGSVHRHPGAFGFSATDLKNDPSHPGVIFRNKSAKDLFQVDSVLYIPRGSSYYWTHDEDTSGAYLYTTETRLVNVHPVDEEDETKGIEGSYDTTPTLLMWVKDLSTTPVDILDLFLGEDTGNSIPSNIEWKTFQMRLPSKDKLERIYEMLEPVIDFEPDTIIVPEFVEGTVYTRAYKYKVGGVQTTPNTYDTTVVEKSVAEQTPKNDIPEAYESQWDKGWERYYWDVDDVEDTGA